MDPSARSRADLLRALARLADSPEAELRLAARLGYALKAPEPQALLVPARRRRQTVETVTQMAPPVPEPALQAAPDIHVAVTQAEVFPPEASADTPAARPLQAQDYGPADQREGRAPPPPRLLVQGPRHGPALRSSLQRPRPAGVDLAALVQQATQGRLLRRLPRRERASLGAAVWCIVDAGDAMQPFAADFDWLVQRLRLLYGPAQLAVSHVRDGPCQLVHAQGRALPPGHRLPLPGAGQRVLVLSHLGLLAATPEARADWLAWLQAAQGQGAVVTAWLTCSPAWVGQDLARAASLHCLQAEGSLRRQRGLPPREALTLEKALPLRDELLTHAALSLHLAPERLRDLRMAAPELRQEPALEALCWTAQPLVGSSHYSRALTPEGIARFRHHWAALPADTQQRIWRVMHRHQGQRGAFLAAAEVLVAAAHAEPQRLGEGFGQALGEAQALYDALWSHALAGAASAAEAEFAADMLARQGGDAQWRQQQPKRLAHLLLLAGREEVPDGLDPTVMARAAAEFSQQPVLATVLELRHDGLWLRPAEPGLTPPGRWPLWRLQPARSVVVQPHGGPARRLAAGEAERRIAQRPELPLRVTTERESLTVAPLTRPRWAQEWGRDEQGLYALSPSLGHSLEWRLRATEGEPVNPACPPLRQGSTGWFGLVLVEGRQVRLQLGVEPRFGVYADLSIHAATQRLRWIPPGEFWMGSTDAERGRISDETLRRLCQDEAPRHRVTISQGFWLADTACTQVLWQALMGSNPSRFKGDPRLPVEHVSHEAVQQFLVKLQALLPPGLTAGLPTEAEWEYACRAGTDTAFSFGDHVTHDQINVGGLEGFVEPGAKPGQSRMKTVPVASLPPNAWGLHEMHGNVREWCADGLRAYPSAQDLAVDPEGPQDGARFAVRGGCWFEVAWFARSAFRRTFGHADRFGPLGFRFTLRSSSSSAGTVAEPLPSPGPEAPSPARRSAHRRNP